MLFYAHVHRTVLAVSILGNGWTQVPMDGHARSHMQVPECGATPILFCVYVHTYIGEFCFAQS